LGADGPWLWVNYPVLPWLELVVFGLAFGQWLAEDRRRAYRRGLAAGVALLVSFVGIRALGGFGNLRPRMGETWSDWLSVVKYPPSIAFTTLTMGVNLLLLWLFSRVGERGRRLLWPLSVFGRTPLFFYAVHAAVYLALAYLLTPRGTSISWMLPLWLVGLAILYPLCLWYGRLKRRQPAHSILRFF
jgi:uncharacterized membrane protein